MSEDARIKLLLTVFVGIPILLMLIYYFSPKNRKILRDEDSSYLKDIWGAIVFFIVLFIAAAAKVLGKYFFDGK